MDRKDRSKSLNTEEKKGNKKKERRSMFAGKKSKSRDDLAQSTDDDFGDYEEV